MVLSCDPAHLYYFYWLTYGLWYTGRFRPVLCGSCVELIRIADARRVIDALNVNGHLIEPQLPALIKGLQLQQKLTKQIEKLKYCYVSLFGTFNRMEE
ncbi:hypothetical protein GCM10011379_06740 [Filimonas zeae]|uniref:Uncharacterized protein n=1 Tax=Filimonas zeae TaxID=1737353 RepID=A0A917IPN8_9BACT|nr:hypothetical protein GCM10011379_06740 [Filimonas zeae]